MLPVKFVVRCRGSLVRCSKDCGEVVNNLLDNLRRALTHA